MTLFGTHFNSSRELHFESLFSCRQRLVFEKLFFFVLAVLQTSVCGSEKSHFERAELH